MNTYISKSFARKLSKKNLSNDSDSCWYFPHHPVTNPTKPGKMRIVFDAVPDFGEKSLSKNLISGPDLTNNLVGVLLRFC